jgi:hypothetical protein
MSKNGLQQKLMILLANLYGKPYLMEIASEEETLRFLSALWIRWGESVLNTLCANYELNEEQREAVLQIILKPNDWLVKVC